MKTLPDNADPFVVQHPEGVRAVLYLGVVPTKEDRTRLAVHLASWDHLSRLLVLNAFSVTELYKLLLYELLGARRQQVLTKLQSRINTHHRKYLNTLVHAFRSSPVPSVVRAKDVILTGSGSSANSGDQTKDRVHTRRDGSRRAKATRRKRQSLPARVVYVPSE